MSSNERGSLDRDLELSVLGSMITDPDLAPQVLPLLDKGCFISFPKVYEVIQQLNDAGQIADTLSVIAAGASRDSVVEAIGKANRLAAVQHALVLVEQRVGRDIKRLGKILLSEDGDPLDIADKAQAALFAITNISGGRKVQRLDRIAREAHRMLVDNTDHSGISTGFPSLDKILGGGWRRGDLIIVCGRPSHGKSLLMEQLLINSAKDSHVGMLGSFEMKAAQIAQRAIYQESGLGKSQVQSDDILMVRPRVEQALHAIEEDYGSRIFINDPVEASIGNVISLCTVAVRQHDVELIVIDYLQLMEAMAVVGKGSSREREVSAMSRLLKKTAMILDVPIIVGAQLSRKVEERKDKVPQLSDLRESGSIEQDADVVVSIHQKQRYGIKVTEEGESTAGKAYIDVLKQRDGPIGSVVMHLDGKSMTLSDIPTELIDALEEPELPF